MTNKINLLNKIQRELKAPKTQRNNFGKYNYRSCEDILEAIKPLLGEDGCLVLTDKIEVVVDRVYVVATATLTNGNSEWSATAYAREAQSRKGMDEGQLTGATSSYARKYALNGLFCIDDSKDADTDEAVNQAQNTPSKPHKPKQDGKELKARAWATKAQTDILATDNADDLTTWRNKNKETIVALSKYPALHADLNLAIETHYKLLEG